MPQADSRCLYRIHLHEARRGCAWLVSAVLIIATTTGCVSATHGVRDAGPPGSEEHAPPQDRAAESGSAPDRPFSDGASASRHGPVDVPDSSPADDATLTSVGRVVLDDAWYLLTSPARIDGRSALILGGVAAGIGGLMLVDEDLQDFAQRNRTQAGNDASQALEDIGSVQAVFGGNLVLIGTGWWLRDTEFGHTLMHAALVSLEAQLFTEALAGIGKFAVGRSRPSQGRGADFYQPFDNFDFDRTFPSSHTARAFAVASVFAGYYDQPVPLLAYSAATAMGLSRIFLNDHFASDVLAGAALGLAVGKALTWRHALEDRRLTVLPYVAGAGGGLGITLEYTF